MIHVYMHMIENTQAMFQGWISSPFPVGIEILMIHVYVHMIENTQAMFQGWISSPFPLV